MQEIKMDVFSERAFRVNLVGPQDRPVALKREVREPPGISPPHFLWGTWSLPFKLLPGRRLQAWRALKERQQDLMHPRSVMRV